jgi:hypothetical protein
MLGEIFEAEGLTGNQRIGCFSACRPRLREGRAATICWVSRDEVPAVGSGAALEQVGEGGAGVAFRGVAVELELGEGGVVGLDRGVGGLEGK